jgi:PPOX class probable F420-dependent enzyme
MPSVATNTEVGLDELLDFARTRHRYVLVTTRRDGRPQLSPVTGGVDAEGRIVVSTYPDRAKTRNLRRDPRASYQVVSPDLTGWAVGEGYAELTAPATDPHDATVDALVDLYRTLAGEHPDWDGYRAAMVADRRVVLTVAFERVYGGIQGR